MYIEHKFNKLNQAKSFQKQFKKTYGYNPSILEVSHSFTGEEFYLIVEPIGLKRIK